MSICYNLRLFIFINMVSKKWIGVTITIKQKNIRQTVTIVDDETMYATYRALGLDYIFESEPKKMTFPKTEKKRRTKRTKKSDSNIPEPSEQGSINTNGEDDNN